VCVTFCRMKKKKTAENSRKLMNYLANSSVAFVPRRYLTFTITNVLPRGRHYIHQWAVERIRNIERLSIDSYELEFISIAIFFRVSARYIQSNFLILLNLHRNQKIFLFLTLLYNPYFSLLVIPIVYT